VPGSALALPLAFVVSRCLEVIPPSPSRSPVVPPLLALPRARLLPRRCPSRLKAPPALVALPEGASPTPTNHSSPASCASTTVAAQDAVHDLATVDLASSAWAQPIPATTGHLESVALRAAG
jgi:hypothetical protein